MTSDFNPRNELLKHRYLRVLREAKGYSDHTLNQIANSLLDFERSTQFADFFAFDEDQAIAFKESLRSSKSKSTGRPLAVSSIRSRLIAVKQFFFWLASCQSRGKRLKHDAIEFLSPSKHEQALAKTSVSEKTIPTLEQTAFLMGVLPRVSLGEQRSRAVIAMLCLTACRVKPLSQLRLKHVDIDRWVLTLNAKEVDTKNGKSFITPFFPVDDVYYREIEAWVRYLRQEALFGDNDPLFPKLQVTSKPGAGFVSSGISRNFIQSANTLTKLVGDIFEYQQLPRTSPHRFRDMISQKLDEWDLSVEEYKVFSQSLGHDDLSTTLTSYGTPTREQQRAVMDRIRKRLKKSK